MATRFNEGLNVRSFGMAQLSIAELRAWLARNHQELETDPPLAESGFIQVEVLLCDIERAALGEYTPEAAQAIVDTRPDIAVREIVDGEPLEEVPTWIIATERHLFWRKRLSAAFERGELRMLDPITKQPLGQQPNSTPSSATPDRDRDSGGLVVQLRIGHNSRHEVEAWVECKAHDLLLNGDTRESLARRILADVPGGALGERGALTWQNIERLLPPGITGGRAKNGRNLRKT